MKEVHLVFKDVWYVKGTGKETPIGTDREMFCWLLENLSLDRFLPMTLKRASKEFKVPYSTIAQAAREGRLETTREVGTWLTTRQGMIDALKNGRLRPRKKDG